MSSLSGCMFTYKVLKKLVQLQLSTLEVVEVRVVFAVLSKIKIKQTNRLFLFKQKTPFRIRSSFTHCYLLLLVLLTFTYCFAYFYLCLRACFTRFKRTVRAVQMFPDLFPNA